MSSEDDDKPKPSAKRSKSPRELRRTANVDGGAPKRRQAEKRGRDRARFEVVSFEAIQAEARTGFLALKARFAEEFEQFSAEERRWIVTRFRDHFLERLATEILATDGGGVARDLLRIASVLISDLLEDVFDVQFEAPPSLAWPVPESEPDSG